MSSRTTTTNTKRKITWELLMKSSKIYLRFWRMKVNGSWRSYNKSAASINNQIKVSGRIFSY